MSTISGQAFLPLDDEHADMPPVRLGRRHELFCLEYVKSGRAGHAYQKANPEVKPQTAETNGPRLLRKAEIRQRVAELRKEIEEECKALVLEFHKSAVQFDPACCFDESGNRLEVAAIAPEVRKVMGLEARIVEGSIRYVPTMPTTTDKHRSAESLAKMMAMNKETLQVDVGSTGLNDLERAAKLVRILDAARDRRDRQPAPEGVDAATGTADSGV